MRTWILDLTYQHGVLTGDRMRPPRGTQLREMGLALLGEHATTRGAHDNDLKPRALWLHPPGPAHPGRLHLSWLSDHFQPPRTPPAAGRLNWGQGASLVEFRTRPSPATLTAAQLLARDTDTWTRCAIRTRSGVLFKRGHTHYLNATLLIDAMINRWNLLTAWSPPGHPPRDPLPIPDPVRHELTTDVELAAVRHCAPTDAHQIATRLDHGVTAHQETPLHFDIDLHCTSTRPETRSWFRTLTTYADITGLGRYTPTGLGALTTTPIPAPDPPDATTSQQSTPSTP